MDKNQEFSLAVIGGGASSALLLAHLARAKNLPPLRLAVFDRTGLFFKGIAYGTARQCHLLNVRAEKLSGFEDEPDHFACWAAGRGYKADDFAPRAVYGKYLEEIALGSVQALRTGGHEIHLLKDDIKSVHKDQDRYRISGVGGNYLAAKTVLASGNAAPIMPKGAEILSGADGYYNDPWGADYKKIGRSGQITLLGTGLSMVDAVLSLEESGFKGKITALSRRGLLPSVHVEPAFYADFAKEVQEGTALGWFILLRRHTALAAAQDIPWQAVVDSLRPHTNRIWRNFSQQEREKFLRRLLPFWNVHRHRMAPEIGRVVEDLQNSGRLRIEKANVRRIEKTSSGLAVVTAQGRMDTLSVINCMGYHHQQRDRHFEVTHKIGPPLRDEAIETTAIAEIREQACALARSFCG